MIVSGTNGKGTTALFLSAALREVGLRVATYLSPHLQSPTERFLWNMECIDEACLSALAEEFLKVAQEFELSYFEYLTLLFFLWSDRQGADFQIIECGLGGRLDATNVTDPVASLLTNVAFDHQEYLGHTLPAILNEKLGILRDESLLFSGVREPHLIEIIEKQCLEKDAITYFSKDLKTEVIKVDWNEQSLTINNFPFNLTNPSPGTIENAALAFLTLRIVFPKYPASLFTRAMSKVKTPGRMEIVQENPRVVLSGDHNPAGMKCLLETLDRVRAKNIKTVCAFSPDKPFKEMFDHLKNISESITLTQVENLRSKLPREYFEMAPVLENSCRAVEQMIRSSSKEDTILVTGSLYLIGEVRRLWHSRVQFLNQNSTSKSSGDL